MAFAGDHGANSNTRAVFDLIREEGADLFVSQGDYGYDATAEDFEALVDEHLGRSFRFIGVFGNHEWGEYAPYRTFLERRLARTPDVTCEGEPGLRSLCSFRGLQFVLASPGLGVVQHPWSQSRFIRDALSSAPRRWKFCTWHRTQTPMQVGKKSNDTGWEVFEACRAHGAMIITGHSHTYSRSKTMSEFSDDPVIADENPSQIWLSPGTTGVAVSGLGGKSIRGQQRSDAHWAAIFTATQNARPGALFCRFWSTPNPTQASCFFKTIDGVVVDEFHLTQGMPKKASGVGKT